MDEIQKWNPAEVLEGIDELMNSGAVPAAVRFTPEEIIESYQLAPTMPEDEALAKAANESSAVEEAAVMEEPAVEEPMVMPASEELVAKMMGALTGETVEEAPVEEPAEEPEEEAPVEEPAEEPEEETPVEEPAEEPEEEAPVEEPAEEEAPVEEPAEEPVEEYSLEEIIKEVEGEPEPDKAYSLDAILKEYSEDAPETVDAEVEELVDGLDLDQMAFLIGQNVTDAMSDEVEEPLEETAPEEPTMGDPTLDGLREFFEDARRRVTGGMSRRSSKKMPEPEGVEGEPAADEPTQKVTAMPTPKMKAIRDSFGKIQDKMDDFADHMYADAVTEEEDNGAETVPATDFEQIPAEEEQEPLDATIREKLEGILPKSASKAPDLAADELARRYKLGLGFMGTRLLYLCVLTVAALYVSVAAETSLPLPAILTEQRYGAALLTWLLGFGCALGLDVLWMGITAPFRGRPGMHTLTAAAILATLADGLCCITVGREGPLPFSALAMLGLACSMLGAFWRKRALYQSCRTVARCAEPSRVTLDEDKWNGDAAFSKERGDTAGFGSQIQSMDGAERIYRLWVPIIGILAIAAAILSSVGHGHPGLLTWALSGILVASAPLSGLMAFAHPYFKLTRRLDHSGAVLAGWDGAESMTGRANILLTDEDLFPEGTIIQRSVAQAEGFPLEKLTACIASMLYAAGSGLYHLFDSELRRQGGSYRRVDEMQVYEAGGFSADIRGEQVLVGSYAFMNVMGVEVPEGKRVRSSVFCAINKKMGGIFTLDYSMSHNDKQALSDLVRSGIYPVLVTRDFNIIPSMLQSRFDLPVDKMEYPRLVRRRELSERGQAHNPTLGAIVTRDNVAAYADAVIGGRRLCSVVKVNAIIAVLASLVGLLLGFFLVWSAAFSSLTPLSMLLFLLIWAVPNVAISGAADKF